MATLTSNSLLSLEQTPSKKAAAALAALTFDLPKEVINDDRLSQSPASLTEEVEDDILPIRRKFVGDVDLPESMCLLYHAR